MKDNLYDQLQTFFNSWIEINELSFVNRLARENNWSQNFARRAIREYIKFVYLCSISLKALTPSDEVDQVWHLHLQFCLNYQEMNNLLPRPLWHGPTKGGKEEGEKFDDWYNYTKSLYKTTFNQSPPSDLWPENYQRFNISPKAIRVNPHHYFILNKKVTMVSLLTLTLFIGVLLWIK